jgi:hypothetical protein
MGIELANVDLFFHEYKHRVSSTLPVDETVGSIRFRNALTKINRLRDEVNLLF